MVLSVAQLTDERLRHEQRAHTITATTTDCHLCHYLLSSWEDDWLLSMYLLVYVLVVLFFLHEWAAAVKVE